MYTKVVVPDPQYRDTMGYAVSALDTDVWAAFKLYGVLGLTLVFALLQGLWLASKAPAAPESSDHAR